LFILVRAIEKAALMDHLINHVILTGNGSGPAIIHMLSLFMLQIGSYAFITATSKKLAKPTLVPLKSKTVNPFSSINTLIIERSRARINDLAERNNF
jgi:hypothetical protein